MAEMRFEVFNYEGVRVFWCTDEDCLPPPEVIDNMAKAGYKFKIGGKVVSKSKIKAFYEEGK